MWVFSMAIPHSVKLKTAAQKKELQTTFHSVGCKKRQFHYPLCPCLRIAINPFPNPIVATRAQWPEIIDRHSQVRALLAALPDGLAAPSDSTSLAILAELLAEFWRSPTEFPANRLNPLRGLLAEFGLTLAARRRLEIAPVEQENPFASIGRKP